MGQVPTAPYGIVGDGRLARHLAHYFNLLRISYRSWSRSLGSQTGVRPSEAFSACDLILVSITDSAIEPWIRQAKLEGLDRKLFVHFSGALSTDLAVGLHPLMTFGKGFYELSDYERIPFIGEAGSTSFAEIFPRLKNPSFMIPRGQKSLYHALCVMSGNFTTLLWQKFFDDLEKNWGLPRDAAVPYLERVALNLKQNPSAALTGPLVRGDRQTLEKNLDSLKGDPFQRVYQSFVEAYRT